MPWRIASAIVVTALYLAAGVVAQRWWMAIGDNISVWGREIPSLKPAAYSLWPIAITFCAAIPSAWICLLNRRPLVHLWMYVAPAYQLYVGVNYILHGGYFGCDRNGCSAEENFVFGNILALIASLVGAGAVQFVQLICDGSFARTDGGSKLEESTDVNLR